MNKYILYTVLHTSLISLFVMLWKLHFGYYEVWKAKTVEAYIDALIHTDDSEVGKK